MAGTLHSAGSRAGRAMISGINVTPLVDVVLVLLVILMVSSTYIVEETMKVQLPKAKSSDGPAEAPKTLVLTKDGAVRLDGAPATEAEVSAALVRMIAARADASLVISADASVPHGRVVHFIDVAKLAGVTEFAINVELSE